MLVSCIIPYLFYIAIYKTVMLRSVACLLPYLSLFIGYIVIFMCEQAGRYRATVMALLVVGFIGIHLGDLKTVHANRSGFAQGAEWLQKRGHKAVLGLNSKHLWLSHGIGGIASRAPTDNVGNIDTTIVGLQHATRLPYVSLWLDNYYPQEYKSILATKFLATADPVFAVEHITGAKRVACHNSLALIQALNGIPLVDQIEQWTNVRKFAGHSAYGECVYPSEWHVKLYENRLYRSNAKLRD